MKNEELEDKDTKDTEHCAHDHNEHDHESHDHHDGCCAHEHDHESHDHHDACCAHEHDHESHDHHDACCVHEHDHESHDHHDACCAHEHDHLDEAGHEHGSDTHHSITHGGAEQKFLLAGLDCPNCAAKIEYDVSKLAGVELSSVNLIKQTLTVATASENQPDLLPEVERIVHKYEPDVEVRALDTASRKAAGTDTDGDTFEAEKDSRRRIFRLAFGAFIYIIGVIASHASGVDGRMGLALLVAAYVILGYDVVWTALKNIGHGQIFDENFLMSVSTVGAFGIGSYSEAVAVMLFYQIGEFFQDMAVARSRKSIADMMDIRPDTANLLTRGEVQTVSPEEVKIGDHILVRPGERIPLDGIIIEGESMLDTRALTGESVPRSVGPEDAALSGCINQSGALTIEVTRGYEDSTVSKIIDLVENASARKAPTENFITKFARYYTPIVVLLALALAIIPPLVIGGDFTEWLRRCFTFLVISCPCALVISIPLTFFSAIGAASRKGVLVKGGNYLEALDKVETVVFDKTGTLTKGTFKVVDIAPQAGTTDGELLELAAYAEALSTHPIARSIVTAYGGDIDEKKITNYQEISGKGVSVNALDQDILAGNAKLMRENGVTFTPYEKAGTKVYVAADGAYAGCLLIADEVKADSADAIKGLRALGVAKTVMLTGDDKEIGEMVANELGIDECYAQLLPAQKVEKLEELDAKKSEKGKLVFVGDGINDAPVLARADVGIAMGALGSDAAVEAADVVLMTDEPSKLCEAVRIAKAAKAIVMQNIVFALGVKFLLLVLGALGYANMWEAVFGDVGVMIIAVLNSMRMLKK